MSKTLSDQEIREDALAKYPECSYGEIYNGMNAILQMTRIVKLWRNEECYLANDPPRHVVEGYPGYPRKTPASETGQPGAME